MEVAHHFLVGFKAHMTRGNQINAWYFKSGQGHIAMELTGPRRELTSIILLIEHSIKLSFKCISLNLQITAALVYIRGASVGY